MKSHAVSFVVALLLLTGSTTAGAECGDTGVAVQILGSGGPFGTGRASAGYIVWIDGVSRIMVDAGGGTFAHFHEAGASLTDLQLLALSHLSANQDFDDRPDPSPLALQRSGRRG